MITGLRLALFTLSNVGMWELLRRNTKIDLNFLPSLTIAIQVTVLFVFGILNALLEAAILLGVFGLAGLCVSIYKDKSLSFFKNYFTVSFLFCAVTMLVMGLFLNGKILTDYDNFSHWGLVVKTMLATNRFPNFLDELIVFRSYPLGSSVYIYFFSRLVSSGESLWLLAQVYMLTACIMPVFYYCRKNRIQTLIVVFGFTNLMLVINADVTSLLVDTLLPIVAMCALLYVYNYCRDTKDKCAFYLSGAYLLQITQIKNSGVFFVAVIAVLMLYWGIKNKGWRIRTITIGIPAAATLIWLRHCKYVFPEIASSRHSMYIRYFAYVFLGKTPEEINSICLAVLRASVSTKAVWLTFGLLLITAVIYALAMHDRKSAKQLFLFSVVSYFAYQVGLLLVYLASMSAYEASVLSGYLRYTNTFLVAVLYIVMVLLVCVLSNISGKKLLSYTFALAILASTFAYMKLTLGEVKTAVQYQDSSQQRRWFETAKQDYNIRCNSSYCVLQENNDNGYISYLIRYIFESSDIDLRIVDEESDLDNIRAEYIFVCSDTDKIISRWAAQNYPEQAQNRVIIAQK